MAVRLNRVGNRDKKKHLDVLSISSGFVFVLKHFLSEMVEFGSGALCYNTHGSVSRFSSLRDMTTSTVTMTRKAFKGQRVVGKVLSAQVKLETPTAKKAMERCAWLAQDSYSRMRRRGETGCHCDVSCRLVGSSFSETWLALQSPQMPVNDTRPAPSPRTLLG